MSANAKTIADYEDNCLPAGCDFYAARESGRHAVPEDFEEPFKKRFDAVIQLGPRDYRNLIEEIVTAAQIRGYEIEMERDPYMAFSRLFSMAMDRAIYGNDNKDLPFKAMRAYAVVLYCDVFVDAILSCPQTEKNVFI